MFHRGSQLLTDKVCRSLASPTFGVSVLAPRHCVTLATTARFRISVHDHRLTSVDELDQSSTRYDADSSVHPVAAYRNRVSGKEVL